MNNGEGITFGLTIIWLTTDQLGSKPSAPATLRQYPMRFAREVLDLVEPMKASTSGLPELPENLPPAISTFTEAAWEESDVWMFVDLPQVYKYLRGNRNLQIPEEWRPFVPSQLSSD